MLPRLTTPTLNQTYTELPLNDSISSVLNQTEPEPILTNLTKTNSPWYTDDQSLFQGEAVYDELEVIPTNPAHTHQSRADC